MSEGIIYITRTEQDHPNYYKVGRTKQSSTEERIRHDATYISGGIEPIKEYRVTNDVEAEKAAHTALANVRVDVPHAREIFKLDKDILIGRVKEAIKNWLIEEVEVDENKWILEFISATEDREPTFSLTNDEDQNIRNVKELMMRVMANPRGTPAANRLIEDKPYEELLNDSTIGTKLHSTLQFIDHRGLVKINWWVNVFRTILFLTKAPRPRRGRERGARGLNGININEIIAHWCESYFNENPKLISGCLEFIEDRIQTYRDYEAEDYFVRGAKNEVYKKAAQFCIDNPNYTSAKVSAKLNHMLWNDQDRIRSDLGGDFLDKYYSVRGIISDDLVRFEEESILSIVNKNSIPRSLAEDVYNKRFKLEEALNIHKTLSKNNIPQALVEKVYEKRFKLEEALDIHKTVSQTKWVKKIKIGENFIIEDSETVIPLSDIYNGTLDIVESLNKNMDLQYERNEKIKKEKEFKERLVVIKDQFKLDRGTDVDIALTAIQDKLFKIFRLLKKQDSLLLKEIGISPKVHKHIEGLLKMVEGGFMNPSDIRATEGLRFVDPEKYGFSHLVQGNLTLAFSPQDQYILWKNNFFSVPQVYSSEDDVIIAFIENNMGKNG